MLQIVQIYHKPSYTKAPSISNVIQKETNSSKIDLQVAQPLFQSRTSSYYPHLPIHIYNQNLSSLRNRSKLILMGNGFFGDGSWGLNTKTGTSTELSKMKQLSCPYLGDYCDITTDKNRFSEADAVIYHMRDKIDRKKAEKNRRPHQRFVFALWESPPHTPNIKSYKKFFNWTMTYRFQSHVVASYYSSNAYIHTSSDYYRYLLKENTAKNLNLNLRKANYQLSDEMLTNKNLGTAAALISNCGGKSGRLTFIRRLQRHMDVKIYGRCGNQCPENVDCREFIGKRYYFFLSFENSLCTDYTTEKFFSVLEHPIVPIVYGRTDYSTFIPSSGFINVNKFSNFTALAQYLKKVRYDKEKYLSYFSWKKDYVWGVSQLFTPICDVCLRLHLDSTPNVIDDMDAWWNANTCQAPKLWRW
ncbi:unnamed protein product [Rotaria socialis]|uniref:Fucosyltransferase n=2 Tax=Rotaria socialis TaxID=392032 RepID=A0A818C643_9BILA|nr:unnamed protein product [Rotaria socialis]